MYKIGHNVINSLKKSVAYTVPTVTQFTVRH